MLLQLQQQEEYLGRVGVVGRGSDVGDGRVGCGWVSLGWFGLVWVRVGE